MGTFFAQIQAIWSRLETPQRASIVLIGVAFLALVGVLLYGATRPQWRALGTGMSRAQVAEIANFLDGQGVAYQVADRETAILVPADAIHRLRFQLAENDLLGDEGEGFELLDNLGFGQSNLMERRMYDRAVAGELERAVREIPGVASARVIISRPQPSPFLRDDDQPAISVKVTMAGERRLADRQVRGITHLAAAAVEGMVPERVQVVDDQGLLTRGGDEDDAAIAASSNVELRIGLERQLSDKAQAQLDQILGPGRSTVSVGLDLDFTKRTRATSKPIDPVAIRTTTRASEKTTPVPANGGIAGTQPNVEGVGGPGGGSAMASETMEEEVTENAAGKDTTTVEEEVGRIRGMTVSIVLDQKETRVDTLDADGNPTGESQIKREDYSPTEQSQIQDLVLNAIGYHAAMGAEQLRDPQSDPATRFAVSIASLPMYRPQTAEDTAVAATVAPLGPEQMLEYGRWAAAAIVALGLLIVARGQLKRSHRVWAEEEARKRAAEEERQRAEQQAIDEAKPKPEEVEEQKRLELREMVRQQVADDPDRAAGIVRGWLHD